jgi:O-antigen biosynthesis protein
LERGLIIYDCIDRFPLFHENASYVIEAEERLVSKADIVFATATGLYDRLCQIKANTFLLPNAADYEHFAYATTHGLKPPSEIADMPKPILGYMGEMAQWFDFDLVYNVAAQHPEWSIVLIGLVHANPTHRLFKLPNVYRLGRRDYADLPAYVNQFDVCLLPFLLTALTAVVNPVKLYEYLAAGKPVVSTPMREVLRYQDVVEIADRSAFSTAIQRALRTNSEAKIQQRVEFARRNTWDQRVEEIIRVLQLVRGSASSLDH